MRSLRIIVPFKQSDAKSRLSSLLSTEERRLLAFAMLIDVLDVVSVFGEVTVLSRPGLNRSALDKCVLSKDVPNRSVEVVESSLELNDAINALIETHAGRGWQSDLLIAMADMALLTEDDMKSILKTDGDVVLSPGRGGGTNMILIRSPRFRTCYRGLSFPRHLDLARRSGLDAGIYASYRTGCDIDEPEDLAEVLIHGQGRTKSLLETMGFSLSEKGRANPSRG